MHRVHFIPGLPRFGPTLPAVLPWQNPLEANMSGQPAGMLGYAPDALKEARSGEHGGTPSLARYETLAAASVEALVAIDACPDEVPSRHHFRPFRYAASAFDAKAGMPRLPGAHHSRGDRAPHLPAPRAV